MAVQQDATFSQFPDNISAVKSVGNHVNKEQVKYSLPMFENYLLIIFLLP